MPKVAEDATRIGAGAVVGAIIGGLLGGGKGALLGVLVGGGGTIAATEGSDVDLPVGTVLRIRVDQAVEIPKSEIGSDGAAGCGPRPPEKRMSGRRAERRLVGTYGKSGPRNDLSRVIFPL